MNFFTAMAGMMGMEEFRAVLFDMDGVVIDTRQSITDFWQAVATQGRMNLHVLLHHGRNTHHISEAIFKGAARALRAAFEPDPRCPGIPSTKGTL